MNYIELCTAVEKELIENGKWGVKRDALKLYKQGYQPQNKEEKAVIEETNRKHMGMESEIALLDFIEISNNGNLCILNLEYLHDEYRKNGGWNRVIAIIEANMRLYHVVKNGDMQSCLDDYEMAKSKLIIRPLHYPTNRLDLKDCIYTVVSDIALVLYTE